MPGQNRLLMHALENEESSRSIASGTVCRGMFFGFVGKRQHSLCVFVCTVVVEYLYEFPL